MHHLWCVVGVGPTHSLPQIPEPSDYTHLHFIKLISCSISAPVLQSLRFRLFSQLHWYYIPCLSFNLRFLEYLHPLLPSALLCSRIMLCYLPDCCYPALFYFPTCSVLSSNCLPPSVLFQWKTLNLCHFTPCSLCAINTFYDSYHICLKAAFGSKKCV